MAQPSILRKLAQGAGKEKNPQLIK